MELEDTSTAACGGGGIDYFNLQQVKK